MFSTAVIRHTVKLQAREVGANVREVIEDRARSLIEGVCGEHGYVRPNSLRMMGMSHGKLSDIDMGKSYSFDATFKAEVCNPVRGLRFNALVRSMNRFGMLCEGGYYDPDNSMVPVIEVVVVRNPATIPNEVDVGDLQIGDEIGIEILGRNFELRDSRISAFGRTVKDAGKTPILDSSQGARQDEDYDDGIPMAGIDLENDSTSTDGESVSDESQVDNDVVSDFGDGTPVQEGEDEDFNVPPDVDVEDEGFDVIGDDMGDIDDDPVSGDES